MNKVHLIGRFTKEPSMGGQETAWARFTLAVDRRYKKDGDQSADFISCVAFGKTAEFIGHYLIKGSKVGITGHIQTGSYTNKDGKMVYTTDVIVEEIEFCEKKSENNSKPVEKNDDYMSIPEGIDDEIPFG